MKLPQKSSLINVYGEAEESIKRFENLSVQFTKNFNKTEMEFFTAPGRTEIVGNHTDHNGGKVIAGSITLDTIGAAYPNGTDVINIVSEGFEQKVSFNIADVDKTEKCNGTLSLVAGMVKACQEFGFKVSGFDCYASTTVISSAGVSSSASFEMLVCSIINYFFNDGKMDLANYARIGQYSENVYWCKASGLMDQMACAAGGAIELDFSKGVSYKQIDFDFTRFGYDIVIVNTGKGHADLSADYSSVPAEMKEVAKLLGAEKLADTSLEALMKDFNSIVEKTGNDRAVLRAIHFFEETRRVNDLAAAIKAEDKNGILKTISESGRSSWELLQNCYTTADLKEQKIPLCLARTELFLNKIGDGVCRIHGGGFAGVIMAIIPSAHVNEYIDYMSDFVGRKNVYLMNLRKIGAAHIE